MMSAGRVRRGVHRAARAAGGMRARRAIADRTTAGAVQGPCTADETRAHGAGGGIPGCRRCLS